MFTLFSFYRSKQWRDLLSRLKLERLNADGLIICEECGKPITRAYDLIGHHKQELTEDNVNDFDVSLNPDNIAFVHHRCHNAIHNKLGYATRQVYLVYGAPLSGKSAFVQQNANEGDLILDINRIWESVSGCPSYIKPPRLNAVVFKVRNTIQDAIRYRLGRWENAYIVGGYPLQAERERIAHEMNAREVFIDASKAECLQRLDGMQDGRNADEWRGYIEDWFRKYVGEI